MLGRVRRRAWECACGRGPRAGRSKARERSQESGLGQRGLPRPLGPQGAALQTTTRWHHRPPPNLTFSRKPGPPNPRPRSSLHKLGCSPAHLLQPFHAAGRWSVGLLADPCVLGKSTGRQARPGSWALCAPGRESRKVVPLGCSVLIPR